jgi:hypothetical protein
MRHNSRGDLKQPGSGGVACLTEGCITALEERTEAAGCRITNDKDYGRTAGRYGVPYQQIYAWAGKYEKDGPEGLCGRG